MANLASVYVALRPDIKHFKTEAEHGLQRTNLDHAGHGLGRRLGHSMAHGIRETTREIFAPLLVFAGAAGIVEGFKKVYEAGREAQKNERITAQVIKTTGGAARVTAEDVTKLAAAISEKTGIDDDQIRSGANLLLTFTQVRNEVGKGNDIFNQATSIVQDMSKALGQDTKSSAIQLGKALNDPIKGVTALRRVGVSFTADQLKQIKALVASGKTLEAQKLILHELGREFGGTAQATATPMAKLRATLHHLAEELGLKLLPVIDKFAGWLADRLPGAIERTGEFLHRVADIFHEQIQPRFREFYQWTQQRVVPVVMALSHWIKDELLPALSRAYHTVLPGVREAIRILTDAFHDNRQEIGDTSNTIRAIGRIITTVVIPAVAKFANVYLPLLARQWSAVIYVIGHVVIPAIRAVIRIWLDMFGIIINGAAKAFGWIPGIGGKLKNAAKAFNAFRDDVNRALAGVKDRQVSISVLMGNATARKLAQDPRLRRAYGGPVTGPGGPRDDAIPALLSNGEYVINAASAARIGRGNLDAINRMAAGGAIGLVPELHLPSGRRIAGTVRSLTDGIDNIVTALGTAANRLYGGGGSFGGNVERWRSTALNALSYTGSPLTWIGSLLRRMKQESGGNPYAINLWDSNAKRGDPSRGLMQTIGATFNRYSGSLRGRGIYDPLANIVASIRYADARYGSAPIGWNRPGGYDQGGWLMPGYTLAYNGTGRPERVTPPGGDHGGLARAVRQSLEGMTLIVDDRGRGTLTARQANLYARGG